MKKRDIFLSTKKNIIAISTVIVFVCLIVFAIITQTIYASKVLDNVDKQIKEQEKFINKDDFGYKKFMVQFNDGNSKPNASQNPLKKDGERETNIKPHNKTDEYLRVPPNLIVIIYKDNQFENMSRNMYFSEENLPDFSSYEENEIVTLINDDYKFRGITITKDEYTIQILSNIDAEMHSINRLTTTLIGSLVILIILAVIFSTYLASKVIKPVREAYERQIHFVQDASHEMRTPLAVIKGKLELLVHSPNDTIDSHFEYISKMMSEIRGLEKLNSDLLLLSKEDLELGIDITEFEINKLVDDISEFYFDLADIKGKEFNVVKADNNITVKWDYSKVRRAIIILIENAFKYTEENGKIDFIIEDQNKYVKVMIKDNGIGIKEEEQKRIFDRFYRSDRVRGENIDGSGIGLSLLKSIANNFGIKLKVNSKYGEGSEFIMIIPKEFN